MTAAAAALTMLLLVGRKKNAHSNLLTTKVLLGPLSFSLSGLVSKAVVTNEIEDLDCTACLSFFIKLTFFIVIVQIDLKIKRKLSLDFDAAAQKNPSVLVG